MQPPSDKRRTGSNASPLVGFTAHSAPRPPNVADVLPRSSLAGHLHTHGLLAIRQPIS